MKKNLKNIEDKVDNMIRLKSLLREEEIVKNKKTGNVYVVQNMDPNKHDKPTPAEIEKAKATNNGQLPKGEPQPKQTPKNTAPTKPGQKLGGSDFKSSAETPKDNGNDGGMPKLKDLMPGADFSAKPLSQVTPIERQQISTVVNDLAKMGAEAKAKGEQAPNFNLCKVSIPGTNLYCSGNKGIPREDMPQFKGTPVPGSPADKLPKDESGEADTEEFFKKMLEKDGVKVSEPVAVPPDRLKATQSELVGVKVAGMSKVLEDPNHPAYEKITAPIYVSNDGYVLDGHHRWAAVVAHNAAHPDKQIPMNVRVIDEPIEPLVKRSNAFAEKIGIRAKKADTGAAGGPSPIAVAEKKKSKVENFKGDKSGKEIQTIELPGGGQVFGTVHRNTKMVDDILDHIKSTIPQEKWKDVVFVGEGGSTNDKGEIVFHDEMKYAAPKFKQIGAGIDTWDGDELDVHNDQSKLYKRQMEKTGLNQSQVNAGNWASMIGQGEGTDTMSPNDYLDDEGKEFLQNAAKEAGFQPIENWDNPTEQDTDTLYRLSFPEDNGDKETQINDIQVAFNEIRDENILDKSKELQKKGKIPIVLAGESHVGLVDGMMNKKSNLSELSLRGILKSIRK
jgi:hypothetical protein